MKQGGFTLIEIIAVLVILGILAAVAIPKYQDLQEQAAIRAASGAVAAAQSQCTMAYSRLLLQGNGASVDASDVDDDCASIAGDFTVVCTGSGSTTGSTIAIVATGKASRQSATGEWVMP